MLLCSYELHGSPRSHHLLIHRISYLHQLRTTVTLNLRLSMISAGAKDFKMHLFSSITDMIRVCVPGEHALEETMSGTACESPE